MEDWRSSWISLQRNNTQACLRVALANRSSSCMGWREEESTNDTYVDVQVWWEGLSDLRLAERSEVSSPGQEGLLGEITDLWG